MHRILVQTWRLDSKKATTMTAVPPESGIENPLAVHHSGREGRMAVDRLVEGRTGDGLHCSISLQKRAGIPSRKNVDSSLLHA